MKNIHSFLSLIFGFVFSYFGFHIFLLICLIKKEAKRFFNLEEV